MTSCTAGLVSRDVHWWLLISTSTLQFFRLSLLCWLFFFIDAVGSTNGASTSGQDVWTEPLNTRQPVLPFVVRISAFLRSSFLPRSPLSVGCCCLSRQLVGELCKRRRFWRGEWRRRLFRVTGNRLEYYLLPATATAPAPASGIRACGRVRYVADFGVVRGSLTLHGSSTVVVFDVASEPASGQTVPSVHGQASGSGGDVQPPLPFVRVSGVDASGGREVFCLRAATARDFHVWVLTLSVLVAQCKLTS